MIRSLPAVAAFVLALFLAQTVLPAHAADGDAAYCDRLAQLALRYTGSAGAEGRRAADLTTMAAIEDCRRGNTAAGIAALEKKLRSNGFTLPPR